MGPDLDFRDCVPEEALTSLERIHAATVDSATLDDMLVRILDGILEIFHCDRAFLIYPCQLEASHLRIFLERTKPEWPGASNQNANIPMNDSIRALTEACLNGDGPVRFDALSSPVAISQNETMRAFQIRSQLVMALWPKGDDPWALGIHHCAQAHNYEGAVPLFRAIGNRVADAIGGALAMRALRQSEERFRTLVEHAPEAITMLDVDTGLYLDANPMAEVLHGLPRDALIGKIGPADLSPEIQPDGRPSSEAAPDYLSRALAGEFPRFEWMHFDPDGQETLCEVGLARLPDPHRNLVRASISDITERKRAENALRESEVRLSKAAEIAKIGYWQWDEIEDKAIFCSEGLAKMYSVATGEELTAMLSSHAADLAWVHPEDQEYFDKAVRTARESKRGFDIEYRMVNAADEVLHLHVIEEPVVDAHGEIVQSNGITQDITESKQAEEQLRQAQKMKAVGQLTAGVAHDFNNMLAVISGNAELLEGELGADNPRLASVIRATKRAADLTQRLLAFSRRQVLRPETINANSLITDVSGLLRRTLEEHIEIETVAAAGLWNCEVDPAQLENALINLAINARDAMPDGGKLTIETANARLDDDYAAAQAEVTPGQYVMLAVTDTGSGMSPEVREHVFEPFFTTKAVGKGTGLGLAMIYGFVKQSGGHVTVYSEEGEGTTIKLYLPRSTATEAVERKRMADEAPVARGETVLVVEDDPDVRALSVELLSDLGYQVMEAATGPAALEQLGSTTRINLLLTDVVLPGGMNGRELAAGVEQCAPGIPVLYMSGYAEDVITHHGRLDPDAELLLKPFRRAGLARAVRKILDSSTT
jgi:PAS domain S-box-containing protein